MPASPETQARNTERNVWQFAGCEFDDLRYELRVDGRAIELERKPLDLLRYLLLKAGEVVRKEELLEAVWPDVLVVDASLATAVSKLRKALGEQDVIQTVPRVGYRIAVPVTRITPSDGAAALPDGLVTEDAPARQAPPKSLLSWPNTSWGNWWVGVGIAVVVTAAATGIFAIHNRFRAVPQPASVAILPFQNVSGNAALDYLRAAVPDEIARTLATARALTLRPTAASARFSQPGVDFRKVGHELDVNRVVTGHFLTVGDRLQVTMEAVDTDEDRIVWHDSFNVPSSNLLTLQEQIAAIVHGRLATALDVKEFVTDKAPGATPRRLTNSI
jgi:DNA-binding winged helix-turn-helix (wHTH) protein/TolB-like protein